MTYEVREVTGGTPFKSATVAGEDVPAWAAEPANGGGKLIQTIDTGGTAERLTSTSTPCVAVFLKAWRSNSGIVVWGFASDIDNDTGSGIPNADYLEPGEGRVIEVSNANLIWLNGPTGAVILATYLSRTDT